MKLELVAIPCRFCNGELRIHKAMRVAYTVDNEHNNGMVHYSAYLGLCNTCGNPNFYVFEREVKPDGRQM